MVNVCDRALPTTSHRQPSRRLDTQSTSAQFNSLNQITSTTPAAQMHVVGHTDEPAQVTVNGQDATTYPDNSYSAWVPAAPGDNTITVEATDFSPNANTATKSWSAQLAGESPRSFTYDANGNTLSDGLRTYQWDAHNRLVKITQDGDEYEFLYDAFDRRVAEKINGTVVRRFVWDGLALAEQRAADGVTVQKRYYPQGEERIGGSDAGKHFYFRDHLGSFCKMTDALGTVRARFAYDFYGSRTQIEGDLDCEIGFTGHPVHEPTQLVLAPFRAYDPATARWLSRDPIQESGGINLYQYVLSDPVNFRDPLGLAIETPWDAANVAMGATSFVANMASGNYCDATVDGLGLVYDAIATAVPVLPGGAAAGINAFRGANAAGKATKEVILRKTPGRDGATSKIIREKCDGKTNSVTHQVISPDGKIIHQHQTHIGTNGTERRFPDEWVEYPTIPPNL